MSENIYISGGEDKETSLDLSQSGEVGLSFDAQSPISISLERSDELAIPVSLGDSVTMDVELNSTPQSKPEPEPEPTGEYYDLLQAVNGSSGRNVFLIPICDFSNCAIEVDGTFTSLTTSNGGYYTGMCQVRVKASTFNYDQNIVGAAKLYRQKVTVGFDFTAVPSAHRWVTHNGEIIWETTSNINYGTGHYNGEFFIFTQRAQNNNITQTISEIRYYEGDTLAMRLRPWKRFEDDAVGLKDTITGVEFYPQFNDTIVARNE